MTNYAMRVSNEKEYVEKVFNALKGGEGRFGWSYVETADLRKLRERYEQSGWDNLNKEEKDCYQEFLLRLRNGDHVVYINVPEWGQCTLAKITGEYEWRYEDGDFNHRFPVDSASVQTFDRNGDNVPAALCARLKLQSRWWTIYVEPEFDRLLESLRKGDVTTQRSSETNLEELLLEIRPHFSEITKVIQHTHPGKDLEPFVGKVFERLPSVKSAERQEGRADHGADLLVEFEFGSIPGIVQTQTLAIQVKSYTGKQAETGAVKDLRRAFEYYESVGRPVDMGLIVSTAERAGEGFKDALDKLREESGKPVSLLIGADLAAFFLSHGGDLLR